MKVRLTLLAFLLLPALGFADTFLVPDDFPTIQDAIDIAQNGDLILVKPGTYIEQITFKGLEVTIRSDVDCDPLTHDIAPALTIIDGDGLGSDSLVKFTAGETAASVLDGFTITNGTGAFNGVNYFGGGIFCLGTSPTIINNIVIKNAADYGAGIYCRTASPVISGNEIAQNSATISGGGIMCDELNTNPEINYNVIRANTAGTGGGGIQVEDFCEPTIFNNILKFNGAPNGAAIQCYSASPDIVNNLIKDNSAAKGGAIYCYTSAPDITNNTIYFNGASGEGGGLHCFWYSFPAVTNNIFWANTATTGNEIHTDATSNPMVTYCDIQGGTGEPWFGTGCIDADPLFLDELAKNLHLTSLSPCLDSGDNAAVSLGTTDFNLEPRQNGVVDMGIDEFYAYPEDELHVPAQYTKIQDAIVVAPPAATILVAPKFQKEGNYRENLDFLGKDIIVRSDIDSDPLTLDTSAADTIIDGRQTGSVVSFITGEGLSSVLEGFTLTNGSGTTGLGGEYGGAIYCNVSSPTIINNIIEDNACKYGAGIYCEDSSPLIENNQIRNNAAGLNGGGIMCSESSPAINANIIKNNSASFTGGGIDLVQFCAPIITNNIFHDNSASESGGGISCYRSTPTVMNNTLVANTATITGGGIFCEYDSNIKIKNTILWMNAAPSGPEVSMNGFSVGSIDFCVLMGSYPSVYMDPNSNLGFGLYLINKDPVFEDPSNSVFLLSDGSWCIGTGTNTNAPLADIQGDARPNNGNCDIGADEYIGVHALSADAASVSAAAGGVINFTLDAGLDNAGRSYLLVPNVLGVGAGLPLPGGYATLPLTWDFVSDMVFVLPIFQNYLGILDGTGAAAATFLVPSLPGNSIGFVLNHAFTLSVPFDYVSNIAGVEILP